MDAEEILAELAKEDWAEETPEEPPQRVGGEDGEEEGAAAGRRKAAPVTTFHAYLRKMSARVSRAAWDAFKRLTKDERAELEPWKESIREDQSLGRSARKQARKRRRRGRRLVRFLTQADPHKRLMAERKVAWQERAARRKRERREDRLVTGVAARSRTSVLEALEKALGAPRGGAFVPTGRSSFHAMPGGTAACTDSATRMCEVGRNGKTKAEAAFLERHRFVMVQEARDWGFTKKKAREPKEVTACQTAGFCVCSKHPNTSLAQYLRLHERLWALIRKLPRPGLREGNYFMRFTAEPSEEAEPEEVEEEEDEEDEERYAREDMEMLYDRMAAEWNGVEKHFEEPQEEGQTTSIPQDAEARSSGLEQEELWFHIGDANFGSWEPGVGAMALTRAGPNSTDCIRRGVYEVTAPLQVSYELPPYPAFLLAAVAGASPAVRNLYEVVADVWGAFDVKQVVHVDFPELVRHGRPLEELSADKPRARITEGSRTALWKGFGAELAELEEQRLLLEKKRAFRREQKRLRRKGQKRSGGLRIGQTRKRDGEKRPPKAGGGAKRRKSSAPNADGGGEVRVGEETGRPLGDGECGGEGGGKEETGAGEPEPDAAGNEDLDVEEALDAERAEHDEMLDLLPTLSARPKRKPRQPVRGSWRKDRPEGPAREDKPAPRDEASATLSQGTRAC